MTRPQPYIGVAGVTTRAEAAAALAVFPACDRLLAVGVLVSEKTIAGQRNKWWRRYTPVEHIAGIFVDDPRVLNLVHYSADTPPDADTLLRLFDIGGPLCDGIQFNGAWPLHADMMRLDVAAARRGRRLRIVFQCGQEAGAAPRWSFALPCIADSAGVVTDVLLDASGGRGQALDLQSVEASCRRIRANRPLLSVGVAGGLCAETLPPVAPLLREGVSADAEGRLRDDADGGGNLAMDKVAAYLAAAGEAVVR